VTEAKEDHQDEHEEPSRIVEDRDKSHGCNGDEEDGTALSSKEGVGNMPSIQLSHWKEVEGGYEEANPSGISNGMKHHINILRNLSKNQSLDDGEEIRICQTERSLLDLSVGINVESFKPMAMAGMLRMRLVRGPATPVSKIDLRDERRPSIRMTAPNVPKGERGNGRK